MKTKKYLRILILLSAIFGLVACQSGRVQNEVTNSQLPVPTSTKVPPLFPSPTLKPPTPTPTLAPPVVFVPRYMLLSPPYFSTTVLGTQCNYKNDSWNQQSAYMAYACPELNVPWISVRFTTLEEGQTALDLFGEMPGEGAVFINPGEIFKGYDNLNISGRIETGRIGNSEYAYFMLYETERFVITSEVFFPENTTKTLEDFFPENGDVVLNAFLEIILEEVNNIATPPEPTPMAFDQQNVHGEMSNWLVGESEANEFYQGASDMWSDPFDGTWKSLGDDVDAYRESVCRNFNDRTNEDAPLVSFINCVFHVGPNYDLNKILADRPYAILMESAFEYPDQSIIYVHDNGPYTALRAFVYKDDYLFYVSLDSRSLGGQTAEDVFTEFNDSFMNNVLMNNLEQFDPIVEKTLLFEDLFYRSIYSGWSLIRLNDGQWNVTEQTGLLKVYLAPTTQGPDSLLLRWITEEDFEIITRVLFEPKRNFQRAGIVIYENRDNFVAIVRGYTDWEGGRGNGIFLDHASPSALSWNDPNYENYETQISSRDDVYLKLRREQDVYTGYYSLDGESWIKIGELTSPIQPISHGLLIGKSDTEIFALFDFYELYSLE